MSVPFSHSVIESITVVISFIWDFVR